MIRTEYPFKCDALLPQNHVARMSNLHIQVTEIM
jgi:hypothetical protein